MRTFVRETAYTHMNRLLALKCLEARGLITETITTRPIYDDRSQRHHDYLNEHPQARHEPDQGLIAMLREAYAEVKRQIGVLFDPESDYGLVWPRHTILQESIARINALDTDTTHEGEGEPEVAPGIYTDASLLGWAYQYFREEEKKRVFYEIRKKKKKISGHDIVLTTTAYTERYMVRFLLENSLGALWMEMYPDSDLCQGWTYFVEDPNLRDKQGMRQRGREPRPVAELTLLDPASGGGHFLLYAFDLFAQMYEAEARMQKQKVNRTAIARSILRHNLYGIDIDLRSTQLAAFSLYVRACAYAGVRLGELQEGAAVRMNLVCADIALRRGTELEELLDRFQKDPLTQDLVKDLWHGLENARELGSLLKVEEALEAVKARKRATERAGETWEVWKQDLLDTLKDHVGRAAESFDINRHMFGQQGPQLLDLLARRYDVVATNPPYMSSRDMGPTLKASLRALYPSSGSDLYTAFIERCAAWTRPGGLTAMITQQSFLFLPSYERLRKELLSTQDIRTLVQLGPGAFEDIGGEKVNTCMFVIKSPSVEAYVSQFIRLNEAADKRGALLAAVSDPSQSEKIWPRNVQSFLAIPRFPIAYWASEPILEAFKASRKLGEFFEANDGNKTAHNARYIRHWWEVGERESVPTSRWRMTSRVAGQQPFYSNYNAVVDWSPAARAFYARNLSSNLLPDDFWDASGITFSRVSSSGFTARLLPQGYIADVAATALFPHQPGTLRYWLGFLNSTTARHLLDLLNPTINYSTGDLMRVPFVQADTHTFNQVTHLTQRCTDSQLALLTCDPVALEFKATGIERHLATTHPTLKESYAALTTWQEEQVLHHLLAWDNINLLFLRLYNVVPTPGGSFPEQLWPDCQFNYPLLSDPPPQLVEQFQTYLGSCAQVAIDRWAAAYHARNPKAPKLSPRDLLESELTRLYVHEGLAIEEICVKLELNPVSVVALRRELGLVNPAKLKHEVENFLTHRVWELCKRDEDGIIPYPALLAQVRGEIKTLLGAGRAVAVEAEMDALLGRGGLAGWLGNPFFKKHVRQFKRRPILWQLASPARKFRVLVYYHRLDHDTLPTVRSQYLRPLLERAQSQLQATSEQAPPDAQTVADLQAYVADLQDFDRRLERVIQGTVEVNLPQWANGPYRGGQPPYHPDPNDGVKVNLLPLQAAGLLPVKVV